MSGIHQLLLGGSATAQPVDPYFYSVTSLLHGDGTNGAQNNTFLDSSTNNFTITRNGNTTQGSFSPFSQTGWSNFFGSTNSDWINFSASSALSFASDFTVEAWVYNNYSSGTFIAALLYDSSSNAISSFEINNGTNFPSIAGITSLNTVTRVNFTGSTVPVGQWVHVAWVRSSGVVRVYVNGFVGSTTLSNSATTGQFVQVANARTSGNSWNGYISNLRITSSAVYTSNFTPSTTPLTAIAGTQLLTCQSNRFRDASTNALTPTLVGSTSSVQPFSPFNPLTPYSTSTVGGSGYFDGSGDYLQNTSVTNQFDVGSAFTLELWVYVTTYQEAGWVNVGGSTVNWSTTTGLYWSLYQLSGTLYWQTGNGSGGAISMITATSPSAGAWHHVAIGYNGTTTRMWIDGASVGTSTSSYFKPSGTDRFQIGGFTGGSPVFQGYFSGVRFVKGTDVYGVGNTTLTVPTAPPTAISGTSLLTNFTNAGIFDNAADADYETVGNAQISTSVKKYGTGSMSFDGTGDWLVAAPSANWDFGSGDFTIEMWVNPSGTTAGEALVSKGNASSTGNEVWTLQWYGTNQLAFFTGSAGIGSPVVNTGSVFTTGTWYHVAVCRVAGVTRIFVNGTVQGSSSASYTITAGGALYVGAGWFDPATRDIVGYIDDLRISKGVGRYPYNFTPPTAEFPNIGGTVTLTADPYFDYTTLLLPGNGTNGAQNNTFLDSSTNNFTITRNGNTTQGTFSPFSQTGWGNYFDGTGDYLTFPADAAFTFGTGDFTVEGWVYISALDAVNARGIFQQGTSSFPTSVSNSVAVGVNPAATWAIYAKNAATNSTATATLNSWTHFALVRSGTTTTLYANGTSVITVTADSTNYTGTFFGIGSIFGTSGTNWNGYISNLRVVKGTAVYTANFTPSTTPLTAITNTSLLTCQSNRFVDNSSNAFAITRNGDVSVQAFSPFNPTAAWSAATYGGSGYFDGSGDYITVPDNAAFDFGSGEFTVEAFFYPTSTGDRVIVSTWSSPDTNSAWEIIYFSGTLYCQVASSSTVTTLTTSSYPLNQWNHIAMVRTGNTLSAYLNGTRFATTAYSSTINNGNNGPSIGARAGGSSFPYLGYLSGVRVIKGAGPYDATSSSLTVPTAPLTAITNTQLLTNFTNAGIYDATSKNDLETVGNAQISTTQSKFGGSSMYFDGTGDYLYPPIGQTFNSGTGDFTFECWAYFNSVATGIVIGAATSGGNVADSFNLYISASGTLRLYGPSVSGTATASVATGTWYYLAATRYGNTFTLWVNGVSAGSFTDTGSVNGNNASRPFGIGRWPLYSGFDLNAYLQDVRYTRGIARYTSNFTPPTTAFLTL